MGFISIGVVTSVLFLIISFFSKIPTYRINAVFLIPILWAPYFFRKRLHLQAIPFALYAIALLLHDLGAFGLYQKKVLGLSFDIYVHFYFAIPVSLILHRALTKNLSLRPWPARIATVLVMMGFGALHEIMEFGTYLVMGEKHGMLKLDGYRFDTQRDLVNNLAGSITALVALAIVRAAPRAQSDIDDEQQLRVLSLD